MARKRYYAEKGCGSMEWVVCDECRTICECHCPDSCEGDARRIAKLLNESETSTPQEGGNE